MNNPKLRPVEALPVKVSGREMIALRDPLGWTDATPVVSPALLPILQRFDGEHSLLDIQTEFTRETGHLLPSDLLKDVVAKLDEALILNSPRFAAHRETLLREFAAAPVREAAHAGASYPGEPAEIIAMFDKHFESPDGPDGTRVKGEGQRTKDEKRQLVGLVAPHIDPRRGGPSFAWAYHQLRGRDDIEMFVVLGTGHQPMQHRFGALRKDYETPFGVAKTDNDALRALAAGLPFDLFADEWPHRREHSIEFQVVYLQYLFGGKLKARIAPVLAGSFHEFSQNGGSPMADAEVSSFTAALRKLVEAQRGKVCVIAGVDFAHIGGRFGDEEPMDKAQREQLRREDEAMMAAMASCDAEKFHQSIAAEKDARRICGYPAIYTLLAALQPRAAHILHYGQSHEPDTNSVVSFGAMAFYV